MNITYEEFNPEIHEHLAYDLGLMQAKENPQMLPLNPETISRHLLGVIAHIDNAIAVAYNAVTMKFEPTQINAPPLNEIGGLFISPDFRRSGAHSDYRVVQSLKTVLHSKIPTRFQGEDAIVFANPMSLKLNTRPGFVAIGFDQAPKGAFDPCKDCSRKCTLPANQLCCDTLLKISSARLVQLTEPGLVEKLLEGGV